MPSRILSERIADVLTLCEQGPDAWPRELRTDCAMIHAKYEALKLDLDPDEALRRAKAEWVAGALKSSGLVRVVYHWRSSSLSRP